MVSWLVFSCEYIQVRMAMVIRTMLYHFLLIMSYIVYAIFSVLVGIITNIFLNDYGIWLAIFVYICCFFVDYVTTIRVKNYTIHEINPIFQLLNNRLDSTTSFMTILSIGITINLVAFFIIQDTILAYILCMTHLCIAANNHHYSKKMTDMEMI